MSDDSESNGNSSSGNDSPKSSSLSSSSAQQSPSPPRTSASPDDKAVQESPQQSPSYANADQSDNEAQGSFSPPRTSASPDDKAVQESPQQSPSYANADQSDNEAQKETPSSHILNKMLQQVLGSNDFFPVSNEPSCTTDYSLSLCKEEMDQIKKELKSCFDATFEMQEGSVGDFGYYDIETEILICKEKEKQRTDFFPSSNKPSCTTDHRNQEESPDQIMKSAWLRETKEMEEMIERGMPQRFYNLSHSEISVILLQEEKAKIIRGS